MNRNTTIISPSLNKSNKYLLRTKCIEGGGLGCREHDNENTVPDLKVFTMSHFMISFNPVFLLPGKTLM